ncbi:MAG TPA: mycothiol synthase [Acidimicrobiales bacterium]|nr:mycothiol synthase [Acidimicrobiales bacterium]
MEVLRIDAVDLRALTTAERAEVSDLVARAAAHSEDPPLPEPQRHAITDGSVETEPLASDGHAVLARSGDALVGGAFLFPARDGSTVLHLVVDPAVAGAASGPDVADALLGRAIEETPAGSSLHLWAMDAGPADDERALARGFTPERDLLQMRVPLPLPREAVEATRPLQTRPFEPGRDEEAWVETNNRAFEGHPEQGGWTVEQLRERMAADWVDLEGFLVADDPDGKGLIGSCWTKVHRDHVPVLGEIYVIAVDPRHHGRGWGRSLTVAGLESLAQRGVTVGMLYTDASNEAAVGLYDSLGFRVHHVDRSYRRDV